MIDIQGVLVSEDVALRWFSCDLEACHGACCIEGDAGAPITEQEATDVKGILPEIQPDMAPRAVEAVKAEGIAYRDVEGELVTQLLDGAACAFCTMAPGGVCLCAIDKARREGRITVDKPLSCALYPIRLTERPGFTAVNVHRWKICRPAEVKGRREGVRLYQFLRQPLIRRFGQAWYDELALTCQQYLLLCGQQTSVAQSGNCG